MSCHVTSCHFTSCHSFHYFCSFHLLLHSSYSCHFSLFGWLVHSIHSLAHQSEGRASCCRRWGATPAQLPSADCKIISVTSPFAGPHDKKEITKLGHMELHVSGSRCPYLWCLGEGLLNSSYKFQAANETTSFQCLSLNSFDAHPEGNSYCHVW